MYTFINTHSICRETWWNFSSWNIPVRKMKQECRTPPQITPGETVRITKLYMAMAQDAVLGLDGWAELMWVKAAIPATRKRITKVPNKFNLNSVSSVNFYSIPKFSLFAVMKMIMYITFEIVVRFKIQKV